MTTVLQLCFKGKLILFAAIGFTLFGCTLNVNLNVSTDKPISLNVVVDKPIEVKLDAGVAVTKLPLIQADAKIGLTGPSPISSGQTGQTKSLSDNAK
ncbi:MAG: hypothetical protein ACOYMG_10865 [Candidatus Methylumidiphilus sp.]